MYLKRLGKEVMKICDMSNGKVFEYNGALYLKIVDEIGDGDKGICRAIDLQYGKFLKIQYDADVKIIKGHFQETKD